MDFIIDRRPAGSSPVFSVIIALYNAEKYFRSTVQALNSQTIDRDALEFIVVNDGSSDKSVDIATEWAKKDPRVVVVSKENKGIGDTRNVGLAHARGQWITAVDPDDVINQEYFSEILNHMKNDKDDEVALYSTRVYITNDETGQFKDSHPLGQKFKGGNRFVSLNEEPNTIQIGATCVIRRDVLVKHQLKYDADLKPTFEDGHLICRYLCHFDEPIVGIVSTAHYFYRKRSDNSSAVQSGWQKVEKFTVQPERGYLSAAEYAVEKQGKVPNWLAMIFLYDLMWYFKAYNQLNSPVKWLTLEENHIFMDICQKVFSYMTWDQLNMLVPNAPNFALREALGVGFGIADSEARLFRWGKNTDGTVNWTLHAKPGIDTLELYLNGKRIEAQLDGVTQHEFYKRVLMQEVAFSVEDGELAVFLNGKYVPIGRLKEPAVTLPVSATAKKLNESINFKGKVFTAEEKRKQRHLVEAQIKNLSMGKLYFEKAKNKLSKSAQTSTSSADVVMNQRGVPSEPYQDCWLLIDHPDRADDNAEHLYRYIHQEKPDVKAFFVLEEGTKDYARLQAEGFRLIPYGSAEMHTAAEVAAVVASSDAVKDCMDLRVPGSKGRLPYKFVFLQHGITKDDLSDWLNPKNIDLCISVTQDEYDAFVWKDSKYKFRAKNVALTGFPRYDRLHRLMEQKNASRSGHSVLIMPTWRRDLKLALDELPAEEQDDYFLTSDYYVAWKRLVDQIVQTRAAHPEVTKVALLMHPNMAQFKSIFEKHFDVDLVDPTAVSFQDEITDYTMFITDYSSVAFDCAYAGIHVAYYQPEELLVADGAHSWNRGYFDYEVNGLGPVYMEADSFDSWIRSVAVEESPDLLYTDRRNRTFVYLDAENSYRTFNAIKSMTEETLSSYSDREELAILEEISEKEV